MIDVAVVKTWGHFRLDVAFQHRGGILGLLGPSGCGKSKTLQCITGIERPDDGHVVVDGTTFFDRARGIDVPVQQRRVGYLFQNYALFPNMTVRQNLACAIRNPGRDRAEHVAAMVQRMGLAGLEGMKPSQLSGGQQQRVALGRILLNGPDLLLLDEPFSALDSYIKEQVMTELRVLLRQFPKDVIVVTHSRDEAYELCDSLVILKDGAVDVAGPTKTIFADPQTRNAAILTGCKNVVNAKKAGLTRVFVPSWGITLEVGRPVRDDLCAIGIRGHAFRAGDGPNAFEVAVVEEIEQPFEWIVKFRYDGQVEGTPHIWWRFSKAERPTSLPTKLGVAGPDILLLYK